MAGGERAVCWKYAAAADLGVSTCARAGRTRLRPDAGPPTRGPDQARSDELQAQTRLLSRSRGDKCL